MFASNVGGTATLIGDPPNILIGSYAGLTFTDFITHLTVICIIGLGVAAVYFLFWFRKEYNAAKVGDVPAMVARLREEYRITDPVLLIKAGGVLIFTVLMFVLSGSLHMEPSIAALAGASLLLVISGVHIVEMVEKEVEWPTLVFFMMLFIVVAGAEQTGLIQIIADWVRDASAVVAGAGGADRAVGVGDPVGDHRQHPVHRHHAAHRRLPDQLDPRRSTTRCCGGRCRWAPASAATAR